MNGRPLYGRMVNGLYYLVILSMGIIMIKYYLIREKIVELLRVRWMWGHIPIAVVIDVKSDKNRTVLGSYATLTCLRYNLNVLHILIFAELPSLSPPIPTSPNRFGFLLWIVVD